MSIRTSVVSSASMHTTKSHDTFSVRFLQSRVYDPPPLELIGLLAFALSSLRLLP